MDTLNNGNKEEYLNANFVDGFRQPRAYIATQGPIQGTFASFWRMVWEQNTRVIVMITHLFESGKVRLGQPETRGPSLTLKGQIIRFLMCSFWTCL